MGASNVGKSSLLNALWGRKGLAYVSKKPGKTSEINFFNVDNRFVCVDLPGYGYAAVSGAKKALWGKGVTNYLENRPGLRHIFLLCDARHPLKKGDQAALEWLGVLDCPFSVLLTKADKVSGAALLSHQEKWQKHAGGTLAMLGVSIKQSGSIADLRRHVLSVL